MALSDPIADMLTRIRNAIMLSKREVEIPASKVKEKIAALLKDEGYIEHHETLTKGCKKSIKIILKYSAKRESVIRKLISVSTSGRHLYSGHKALPRVQGGFGTAIISTSSGIMTDRQARARKVGGEILCYIS